MTREERSIEEAKNRFLDDQIYPISKVYAFVEGVKWADSNPNPEIIKRVLLYALQRTNILLADDWDKVRWNLLIKKAMKE
jgi:hypothetical protein